MDQFQSSSLPPILPVSLAWATPMVPHWSSCICSCPTPPSSFQFIPPLWPEQLFFLTLYLDIPLFCLEGFSCLPQLLENSPFVMSPAWPPIWVLPTPGIPPMPLYGSLCPGHTVPFPFLEQSQLLFASRLLRVAKTILHLPFTQLTSHPLGSSQNRPSSRENLPSLPLLG